MTKESTDLVVLKNLTPAVIYANVDDVLTKIKAEVRSAPVDISTKAGREAVASLAYKVARSKTALDKMGKDLGDANYKAWKAITSERARIEKELDDLRDEVRKPLTDFENAEKERIAEHEAALIAIQDLLLFGDIHPTAEQVKERIVRLSELPERQWQEFGKRAADMMAQALTTLQSYLADAEKREAEAAELARLRAEEIARQQKERDAKIAAEAAEKARIEAEQKAARAAEEAARAAQAERDRIEQEKAVALAKAAQDAAAAQERAEAALHAERLAAVRAEDERREAQLRADAAEAARVEQAAQAELAAKQAARAAEQRQAAAIEAERKRVADEAARVAAEAAKREADKAHRAGIHNAIMLALIDLGVDKDISKGVVVALAKGAIPHTKIEY
jgi:hypothetical protein